MAVSFDVTHILSQDSATPFGGIHTIKMKTYVHTKTCIQIFIVALFVRAKSVKQSKCS